MIVLGGAAALQAGGYLPSLGAAPGADDTRFASQSDVDSLNGEIANLRQALQEASTTASAGQGAPDSAAAQALAGLGERLDALEQAESSTAGSAAALQSTKDSATAAQQSADRAGQTATSAQEAATSATQAASGAQQTADAASQAAAGARQAADAASQAAAGAQKAADDAAATANEGRTAIAEIRDTLGTLTTRLSDVEASNRQARVALAAANLKSAIDSGGPFMSQLETFAKTAGDSETTEGLRGFAADGVPSEQALVDRWPEVRDAVTAALTPVSPDAPVGDQLLSGLRSLVQVRPSGPAPASAEGPDATLSRMDAAIERGDLAAWQTEWQGLPDAAKAASQDFADDVGARLAAQDAVSGALATALGPAGDGGTGSAAPADAAPSSREDPAAAPATTPAPATAPATGPTEAPAASDTDAPAGGQAPQGT